LEEENIPAPPLESKKLMTQFSITDIFVTASEIIDIIQILDLKKAYAPDKISHKMLKIAPEIINEPLQLCSTNRYDTVSIPQAEKLLT
jgi:hypothetical protein